MYIVAALLVMLLVVAIFASQNVHMVDVQVLGWLFSWPLGIVVLASTAAGAVLVALLGLVRHVGLSLRIYDTRGRLKKTETELTSLRSELDRIRATLKEREQDLIAARAAQAAVTRELEEARRHAGSGEEAPGSPGEDNPDPSRPGRS